MAAKKTSATKPATRTGRSTIEVDLAWLDELSEDERPKSRRSRAAPATKGEPTKSQPPPSGAKGQTTTRSQPPTTRSQPPTTRSQPPKRATSKPPAADSADAKDDARGSHKAAGTRHTHSTHSAIQVQSRWLIPPIPASAKDGGAEGRTGGPPPLPTATSLQVKRRGKLPPPLPREEDDDD